MAKLTPVATFPAKTAQAPTVVSGQMSGKGFAALADGVAGVKAKPARKPAAKKAASPVEVAGKALAAAATKPMRTKAAAKPAAKPAAKKAVAAKPAAKKAVAAKAPAKPRSAAAKRATPVPVKAVAKKAAKPATAPAAVKPAKGEPTQHTVKNVKDLIKFLSTMPAAGGFDVERKFGKAKIQVMNIRGRVIAEVTKAK